MPRAPSNPIRTSVALTFQAALRVTANLVLGGEVGSSIHDTRSTSAASARAASRARSSLRPPRKEALRPIDSPAFLQPRHMLLSAYCVNSTIGGAMNKPDFIAYTVIKKEGSKKSYWHRIGAAWKTKDGTGFNLHLDSLPLDGDVVLMQPKPDQADEK
jgi:hypothetical protein